MKRLLYGFVGCLVLGFAPIAKAESPLPYHFSKVLSRAASTDEEIVAFTIDGDLYAATRAGFPDLRIFDDSRAEVPYQLEPELEYRKELTREQFAMKVVSLREEGNAIEVHLQLPKSSLTAEGFSFATSQTNYERSVQISGSRDGAQWEPLGDGIIFDYSRYMDVNNHEVTLPQNDFREFKVLIGDVTDEKESPYKELTRTFRGGKEDKLVERTNVERRTFHIDTIRGWHDVAQERVRKNKNAVYPVLGFDVQQNAADKQTSVLIRTRREPITSFTLETPSRNFSRRAVVEAPLARGVKTDWQPIGEATLANLAFRKYHREQLTISFPERREALYRVVIHNEDNPALDIQGVQATGNVYRVVFLAHPSKTYRVFYGSETADAPKYETATVLSALRREDFQPIQATLGPQVQNADFGGEPGVAMRGLLNNWIFLGAVLILMVVVLAWSLFRAGRRLGDLPEE